MEVEKIEKKIIQRFNELSDIFPEEVSPSDFRIKVMIGFFGDVKNKKILDAGCGKGRFSKILCEKEAEVTGIDPSEELLRIAKQKVKEASFIKASLTDLPFSDDLFDYVFCIEVLEHIPNSEKAIAEMSRVLKRGGKIIIIDKNKASFHRKFFLPNIFIKKYLEFFNKWFYPKNFQFREKWFFSWEIQNILKKYCQKTEKEYIIDNNKRLFVILPFLNLFIAWKGIKK